MSEQEKANVAYRAGQLAFEHGRYRESIECFERAVAFASRGTPLGGEIQLWLINAYAAVDRRQEALALGEILARHPDLEVRKQSQRLIYILKAPKLQAKEECLTKIPDLANLDGGGDYSLSQSRYGQTRTRSPSRRGEPEPVDLSQVNTQDNQFVWVALIGSVLLLGGLLWLS
jgi:tetratricopeptide (TPR) repeat protein